MTPGPLVFDRPTVRLRRERAAAGFDAAAFLVEEVAERLLDRLDDVRRRFPLALDLGAHAGVIGRRLAGRGGIERLIAADGALGMARRAGPLGLVADEEALPFGHGRLDLVLSCFGLHLVNDLPGTLIQIRRALKPDGLFLGAFPGGRTLFELRHALMRAEIETSGGASPRVAPFTDVRDAGGLLQRAGFALPVVDSDTIAVTYPDALALMRDLRGMGQANALAERSRAPLRRSSLARAAAIYHETFADDQGRVPATFEILYLTGWRPHESQQQPSKRGSGQVNLAKALGVPVEVLEGKVRR